MEDNEDTCDRCGDILPYWQIRKCGDCGKLICTDCWPCCMDGEDD